MLHLELCVAARRGAVKADQVDVQFQMRAAQVAVRGRAPPPWVKNK